MMDSSIFARIGLDAGSASPYQISRQLRKLCDSVRHAALAADAVDCVAENKVTQAGLTYLSKLLSDNADHHKDLDEWLARQVDGFSFQEIIDITNYFFKSMTLVPPIADAALKRNFVEQTYRHHEWCNRILRQRGQARAMDKNVISEIENIALRHKHRSKTDAAFVFLNSPYIDNLKVWLKLYQATAETQNLVVIALDAETRALVAPLAEEKQFILESLPIAAGTLGVCGNGSNDLFLWSLKTEILRHFVRQGIRTTYSDLDTYWLKDADKWCAAYCAEESCDAVFMRSNDMPLASLYQFGFAVNCGFVHFAGNERAAKLVDAWSDCTALMYDDQIGVYSFLRNADVSWSDKPHTTEGVFQIDDATCRIGVLKESMAIRTGTLIEPGDQMLIHPRWVVDGSNHSSFVEKILDRNRT